MKTIVLASASPRRKALLEQADLKFIVYPSSYNEIINEKLPPAKLTERLSLEKVKAVCRKFQESIIIAADTLIVCRGKILGKPKDEKDARKMLKFLNGKMHYVITGFTVCDTETDKFVTKSIKSKVYFNKISIKEINKYIALKKPFDKAGAYGIQELPKTFINKIDGNYDNVVGLPVKALLKELKKLGAF
jgi:septum formation protein